MPKPMIGSGTTAIIELSSHSLPEQCDTVVALEGVGRVRSSTRTSLVRAVQPLRKSAVAAASRAPLPKCFAFMGYPPVLLVRQRHHWAAPRKTDASFFELRAGGIPANPRPSAAAAPRASRRGKHVGFSQRARLGVIVRRWSRAMGRPKQHRCRPSRCGSLYGTLFECVARMCTYILVYFSRLKGRSTSRRQSAVMLMAVIGASR